MTHLDDLKASAERLLGHEGRMISMSKSGYLRSRPENVAVCNSRIVVADSGRFEFLWSGDIDLTLWEQAPRRSSRSVGAAGTFAAAHPRHLRQPHLR
jgi:hypothetical protein